MRNLKFPLTYIIMQKVGFTAQWIIDRIYWSSCRVSSKVVQWPKTMLFKLATFPCIHLSFPYMFSLNSLNSVTKYLSLQQKGSNPPFSVLETRRVSPIRPKMFSISCNFFWKMWQNCMLEAPPPGVLAPLIRGILDPPQMMLNRTA